MDVRRCEQRKTSSQATLVNSLINSYNGNILWKFKNLPISLLPMTLDVFDFSHSCSAKDFKNSSTQSSAYPVHFNMAKLEDANGATAFLYLSLFVLRIYSTLTRVQVFHSWFKFSAVVMTLLYKVKSETSQYHDHHSHDNKFSCTYHVSYECKSIKKINMLQFISLISISLAQQTKWVLQHILGIPVLMNTKRKPQRTGVPI